MGIAMAFDFSLFLGCVLESSKMITLWIVVSPMRMLVFLGDGAWILRNINLYSPLVGARIGEVVHCFVEFLMTVLGVGMGMKYWGALELVRHEERVMEKRRRAVDVERLRMAVAATLLTRQAAAPPEEDSDDSLDAAANEVLYVRATPEVRSYAYRHQRDRTYYAPKIVY